MSEKKRKNNPKRYKEGSNDQEFAEDIVDTFEREELEKSREMRKGIQSIPFYRNG